MGKLDRILESVSVSYLISFFRSLSMVQSFFPLFHQSSWDLFVKKSSRSNLPPLIQLQGFFPPFSHHTHPPSSWSLFSCSIPSLSLPLFKFHYFSFLFSNVQTQDEHIKESWTQRTLCYRIFSFSFYYTLLLLQVRKIQGRKWSGERKVEWSILEQLVRTFGPITIVSKIVCRPQNYGQRSVSHFVENSLICCFEIWTKLQVWYCAKKEELLRCHNYSATNYNENHEESTNSDWCVFVLMMILEFTNWFCSMSTKKGNNEEIN